MSDSGIVRKVDELGRIVVPKEIRRTLRIGVGTPIEIVASDGKIILSKYSTTKDITMYLDSICRAVNNMLGCGVIISDRDRITNVAGVSKKAYLNMNISSRLDEILHTGTATILRRVDGSNMAELFEGDSTAYSSQIIQPIICQGDYIGVLVMFTTDDKILESVEVNIARYINSYIGELITSEQD